MTATDARAASAPRIDLTRGVPAPGRRRPAADVRQRDHGAPFSSTTASGRRRRPRRPDAPALHPRDVLRPHRLRAVPRTTAPRRWSCRPLLAAPVPPHRRAVRGVERPLLGSTYAWRVPRRSTSRQLGRAAARPARRSTTCTSCSSRCRCTCVFGLLVRLVRATAGHHVALLAAVAAVPARALLAAARRAALVAVAAAWLVVAGATPSSCCRRTWCTWSPARSRPCTWSATQAFVLAHGRLLALVVGRRPPWSPRPSTSSSWPPGRRRRRRPTCCSR